MAGAPFLSGAILLGSWIFFYARGGMEDLFKTFYVGFVAGVAWPAFRAPAVAAMRGPDFWRTKIARGWGPFATQDFYLELARYKEERGKEGQLPGDVVWAWAFVLLYVATMAFALLLVWFLPTWPTFFVVLGFSIVEFPLAFGCFILYRRRSRRQFDEAVKAGYRFDEFRLGALGRLQP